MGVLSNKIRILVYHFSYYLFTWKLVFIELIKSKFVIYAPIFDNFVYIAFHFIHPNFDLFSWKSMKYDGIISKQP